jgi:uncharacterized Zn finger protein
MNIDDMAQCGYYYAVNGERIPNIISELELLAFNAGITNANTRHNLNISQITATKLGQIEQTERASYKELQTVWGNN